MSDVVWFAVGWVLGFLTRPPSTADTKVRRALSHTRCICSNCVDVRFDHIRSLPMRREPSRGVR